MYKYDIVKQLVRDALTQNGLTKEARGGGSSDALYRNRQRQADKRRRAARQKGREERDAIADGLLRQQGPVPPAAPAPAKAPAPAPKAAPQAKAPAPAKAPDPEPKTQSVGPLGNYDKAVDVATERKTAPKPQPAAPEVNNSSAPDVMAYAPSYEGTALAGLKPRGLQPVPVYDGTPLAQATGLGASRRWYEAVRRANGDLTADSWRDRRQLDNYRTLQAMQDIDAGQLPDGYPTGQAPLQDTLKGGILLQRPRQIDAWKKSNPELSEYLDNHRNAGALNFAGNMYDRLNAVKNWWFDGSSRFRPRLTW